MQVHQDTENVALLWQAFLHGEQEAFARILEIYYQALFSYGTKLTSDQELVKDGIHDLYLDLWQQRTQLGHVIAPKFYLLKALRYKLLRAQSRSGRESHELTDEYDFEAEFTIEHQIIAQEATEENAQRVHLLLAQLSKRQREAIYLRFYQDLAYDEIAQMMGINYHSVVNLIYEAVRQLRKGWIVGLGLLVVFG